ncbi:MAG: discoidin domain-containing protein [Planctomycetes bacterium]|nr:discoidin domain-containing protein [Planctomycetota bacterium]
MKSLLHGTIVVLVCVLLVGTAGAALVPLTGASRTYDQGGAYAVGAAIDGVVSSTGWGVYNGQTTPQTAVFQTTAPVTAPQLTFALAHNYGSDHMVQQFRISATTDASPTVTSGATWTELIPQSTSAGRNLLDDAGANMLRRTGIADTSTYTVTASTDLTGITGFRVETFPANGPNIGASSNGNFVLSEFMVDAGSNLALGQPVTPSAAIYGGGSPTRVTDGRADTFVHGASGSATTYAFTIDLGQPVAVDLVDIFNRGDGCCTDRLTNYRVSVHNAGIGGAIDPTPVWSADVRTDNSNSGVGGIDSVSAASTAVGQYVKVEKIDDGATNYWLQVAEIEVQGDYLANRALGAPVRTSGATYGGEVAAHLTDGDLNNRSHANTPSGGTFSYDIDLGPRPVDANSIYVYNRNDGCCTDRLSNYTVSLHADDNGNVGPAVWSANIRGDNSNSGSGGVDTITAALDAAGDFSGQWVRITGPSNVAYSPQIAEVEVFAPAAPTVALQEATASYHQDNYGSVDQTIDGNTSGGGMGFYNARRGNTVITWEAEEDLTGSGLLTFDLFQNSSTGHALQRFRLSATDADRSLFADGNPPTGAETPAGDNDPAPGVFTLLNPVNVVSRGGATVTVGPNNIITVSGANPVSDTFTVTAQSPLANITGLRLEVLPGPDGYVGRSAGAPHNSNGNAVLTEFGVEFDPSAAAAVVGPVYSDVNLQNATATFDQGGAYTIAAAIDGIEHGSTGWGISGQHNQNQTAVFQTTEPLYATQIVFELNHTNPWVAHKLQLFRLSATTDPDPTATDSSINWFELTPSEAFTSLPGSDAAINLDNTVAITGDNAVPDNYQVFVNGSFGGITGFRLEALTGPNGYVGFPGYSGNIVLSEFNVFSAVPEPSTIVLAALGLIGLVFFARRRR